MEQTNWSRILAFLVLAANLATVIATFVDAIVPGTAVYILAVGAALQAFLARIQGTGK